MMACGGYWSSDAHAPVLCKAVKRLADQEAYGNGLVVWLGLRRYPALLALYTMGIAAIGDSNYGLLKQLLTLRIRTDQHRPEEPVTEPFSPQRLLDRDFQRQLLPGRDREFTALNNHVFDVVREPVREYFADDRSYDEAFDWFEYLVGLVHCDITATPDEISSIKADPATGHIWGPTGRFLWNRRGSDEGVQNRTRMEPGGAIPEVVGATLRAGFWGSSPDRFIVIKSGFDVHVKLVRNEIGVW